MNRARRLENALTKHASIERARVDGDDLFVTRHELCIDEVPEGLFATMYEHGFRPATANASGEPLRLTLKGGVPRRLP